MDVVELILIKFDQGLRGLWPAGTSLLATPSMKMGLIPLSNGLPKVRFY